MADNENRIQIGFDVAELQAISLGPDDILAVKLIGDNFDQETMESLQLHLSKVFTKNKVMVFTMPNNSDIVFQAIKPTSSCGDSPTSYCDDCSCGKKEAAQGE